MGGRTELLVLELFRAPSAAKSDQSKVVDARKAADLSASWDGDPRIAREEIAKHVQEITRKPMLRTMLRVVCGIGLEYWEVRLLWWCRGPESNWLRPPFQGGALPVSYPGTQFI